MFLIFIGFNLSSHVFYAGKGAFEITKKLCGDSKALELAQECFLSSESCHNKLKQTFVSKAVFDFIVDSFVDQTCLNGNQAPTIEISKTFDYGKDSNLSIWSIVTALQKNTVNFTFDPNAKGVYLQVEKERIMCTHTLNEHLQIWFDEGDYQDPPIVYAKEYFRRSYNVFEYPDYLYKLDEFAGSFKHKMYLAAALSGTKVHNRTKQDDKNLLLFSFKIKGDNDEFCRSVYRSWNAESALSLATLFIEQNIFGFNSCLVYDSCFDFLKNFTEYECMASFVSSSLTGYWPIKQEDDMKIKKLSLLLQTKKDCFLSLGIINFVKSLVYLNVGHMGVCLNSLHLCQEKLLRYGVGCSESIALIFSRDIQCKISNFSININSTSTSDDFETIVIQNDDYCSRLQLHVFMRNFLTSAQSYVSKFKNMDKYLAKLNATLIFSKMIHEPKKTNADFESFLYTRSRCKVEQIPKFLTFNRVLDYIDKLKYFMSKPFPECKEIHIEHFRVAFYYAFKDLLECLPNQNFKSLDPNYETSELESIFQNILNYANAQNIKIELRQIFCDYY